MRILSPAVLLAVVLLAGCKSLDMPGSAMYLANRPNGTPFLKVSSGMGAPTLSLFDGSQWTPPRKMEDVPLTEPAITVTPGLANLLTRAYRIDSYLLLEFKPDAKVRGQALPSRYFLQPGGFAYVVPPPKAH